MSPRPAAIGRYEIVSEIARGGMGTLYVAFDPKLDRQIAIKLLNENNAELRERFAREARSAARLRHPHIVTIFDVGEDGGHPYIAMEYLQGQTFAELVQRHAPLTTRRKLKLVEELSDGLAFAHRAGIIHRDVKPANVMVDVNGSVKILDFGIARRLGDPGSTVAGGLIGSLNYMSPEQVSGKPVDRRSDIFAVGSVMYELFAYRQAFPGNIDAGILHRLLFAEPEPLESLCSDLDPDVIRIVERCLQKNPERRYPDLGVMTKDLQRVRSRLAGPDESTTNIKEWPDKSVPQSSQVKASTTPLPSRQWAQREALARRRLSEIQGYLEAAQAALESGDFESAIASCEEILIRDAEDVRALELIDRAKAVIGQRQAAEWLTEAEVELRRGAVTAALALIERAEALNPSSARLIELRRAADEVLRERERLRKRSEAVRQSLDRGHTAYDKGQYQQAVAAGQEALALDPESIEAKVLTERATEGVVARERAELERRAHEAVREARRMFGSGNHAGALDSLARFEPRHELVTQAAERLRAEAERIAEERRHEAERLAKQQRVAAELEDIRLEISRQDYLDAMQHLEALIRAEGAVPEIQALFQQAQAAQAEAEQQESLARDLAEHVARAAGLFARNDLAGAAARVDAALKLNPSYAAALTLRAKIQEGVKLATEQRQNEERRARQRDGAVADALERARHAVSNAAAVAALTEVLDLEPGHAEAQSLLRQRGEALEREKIELRRQLEAGHTRRGQMQQLIARARQALAAGDVDAARRLANSALEFDAQNAEARLLLDEVLASQAQASGRGYDDLTLNLPASASRGRSPESVRNGLGALPDRPDPANRPLVTAPAPIPPPSVPRVTARPRILRRRPSIRLLAGGSLIVVAGLSGIAFLVLRRPQTAPQIVASNAVVDNGGGKSGLDQNAPSPSPVDSTETQLAAIRGQARNQLARGDWRQFLSLAVAGLKLRAGDSDLKQLMDTALGDARRRLSQEHAAAAANRDAVRSVNFGAAVRKERETNQLARAGKTDEAVRAGNEAADLFQLAAAESNRAATATITVPPTFITTSVPPTTNVASTSVAASTSTILQTTRIEQPAVIVPTPPPTIAVPTPTAPPPAPQEPLIQMVLEAFAVGYSRLDAGAVKRVYPSVNERELKRAFDDLRSQRMRIQTEGIAVTGNSATATVTLVTVVDSRVGGQKTNTRQAQFRLEKRNEIWVIVGER